MFWILRRTRLSSAVSFFNTINNNTSSSNNNANCSEKRPARKEYRRLQSNDDIDKKHHGHRHHHSHHPNNHHHCVCSVQNQGVVNDNASAQQNQVCNNSEVSTPTTDDINTCCSASLDESKTTNECYNYAIGGGDVGKSKYCCPCECICNCCQCNQNNDSTCTPHDPDVLNTDTDSSCSEYDFDHDDLKNTYSDDPDDYDESLTCNVCDRSFSCHRVLAAHKQKKRHFGCSACDSLFPSLMALEHHKEEFEHWSGNENCCTESEDDDDNSELTGASEEMERLL
ncbi:uncharacterized protein LOC123301196 [Chrysoperla carnea]|uniref:uncharacterized protein LOC123301196 n=1 Tax=Chrysoperla carnea TaxID=189513 RepID=UPI001D08A6F5|nr:uncharacterized protein LOC123301196 [Chrysoperla carnea]